MRVLKSFLSLLVTTAPAFATPTLTGPEFDAYTQGKTFYYGSEDEAYGAEEYLPNRRVRWTFLDGKCQEGMWYEDSGMICFVYENDPDPQCWSFEMTVDGLSAQFENDHTQTQLYEVRKSPEPLNCLGPDVGV